MNRAAVIRLEQLAGASYPTPFDGQYVVEYDPLKYPDGAWLTTTPDLAVAKTFQSMAEAIGYYRQSNGLRPDGRPDRPLTAFSVSFLPVSRG